MKKLGPAFVCFAIFLAGCGNHAENPSAGSNPASHHLSSSRCKRREIKLEQTEFSGATTVSCRSWFVRKLFGPGLGWIAVGSSIACCAGSGRRSR
jgi:hypothetical protein